MVLTIADNAALVFCIVHLDMHFCGHVSMSKITASGGIPMFKVNKQRLTICKVLSFFILQTKMYKCSSLSGSLPKHNTFI